MSLRGFIIKIAIHVGQDYLRKKYRHPEESLEVDEVTSVEDPAEVILRRLDLQKALEQLPEQSRRILLMRADGLQVRGNLGKDRLERERGEDAGQAEPRQTSIGSRCDHFDFLNDVTTEMVARDDPERAGLKWHT